MGEGAPPILRFFLKTSPIKTIAPLCTPPLKNEAIPTEKQSHPLKSEATFQKMNPRKNPKKSKTLINTVFQS